MRHRLPNRRAHEIREFEFRGLRYSAGFGRFENGDLAEVFLECVKAQSQSAADARDAAVCLSIALQHGVPPEAIRSAVTRDGQGDPSGIIGAVLDLLQGGRADAIE
jgi:ribonucleoside-diphosphate reductase alpha chain